MSLEDDFTTALWCTVDAARRRHYTPTYFMQMLGKYGGVETAKRLTATEDMQQGLMTLFELGLLDESMEAVMLRDAFRPLFADSELAEARRRLEVLGWRAESTELESH